MFRELTPPETFEELTQKGDAVLIDCRAPAEWHFTGVPDLSSIGKRPLLVAIADESGRPNPEGFTSLVNVTEGFEGRNDENGHRNSVEGWKFHKLPWTQS